VVRQGMRPVLIGTLVGVAGCFPATRIIEHLLFRTGRLDLLTFVAVFAILIGVALAACFIPARRAMCVDSLQILRTD